MSLSPVRSTSAARESSPRVRGRYFSVVSAVTLALTLWGFSDNWLWRVHQPSNSDPKFIVHGVFCLAWMLVFFVQANLVRTGNVRLHRRLGMSGFVSAVGVTVSTAYVFAATAKSWETLPFYLKANRIFLPGYALFVALGFLYRSRPDWHRRLLLVATFLMLEPVLSRAFDPIEPLLSRVSESTVDLYWWIFAVSTWNGLFLSLIAYDWRESGRIHPATMVGFGFFWATWATVLLF